MDLSRRSFLGGALSFGALSGCRAFRAPSGLFSGDGARLTLGVISDIHIDAGRGDFKKFGDAVQFEKTLRWFDAQGVDGVVVAGDMADNGMVNQLECVAEAWYRVFPAGRSERDGRAVEQLFVFGNHDVEGQTYDKFDFRYFEKTSFEAAQIRHDPAGVWKRLFHEEYRPIWLKEVKGYQFVGAHWSLGANAWDGIPEVEPWFRAHAREIDRTKPFFFIQHCHPQNTVYGADAWCPDKGYATRALSAFPNAVAFSGHSHTSLTDERSIWQGAFTSIGTSSLRYGGKVDRYAQRQGLLVTVHDDRIVVARRDFINDASLGDDWVIPMASLGCGPSAARPAPDEQPFAFKVRAKASPPPVFAPGARLTAEATTEGFRLTIPCANAGVTRAVKYRIETGLKDEKGAPVAFLAWDAKYNLPRKLQGAATQYLVKAERLPAGAQPTFTVYPVDSFGNSGAPIGV